MPIDNGHHSQDRNDDESQDEDHLRQSLPFGDTPLEAVESVIPPFLRHLTFIEVDRLDALFRAGKAVQQVKGPPADHIWWKAGYRWSCQVAGV